MTNEQDILCRRVYVFRPNERLLERIHQFGNEEVRYALRQPIVVMTEKLPYEQFLEGWRAKILELCELAFIQETFVEYPVFSAAADEEEFFSPGPRDKSFIEKWWTVEEADYIEIPTSWKQRT